MLGRDKGKGEERKRPVKVGEGKERIFCGKRSGLGKNRGGGDKFGGFNEKDKELQRKEKWEIIRELMYNGLYK